MFSFQNESLAVIGKSGERIRDAPKWLAGLWLLSRHPPYALTVSTAAQAPHTTL